MMKKIIFGIVLVILAIFLIGRGIIWIGLLVWGILELMFGLRELKNKKVKKGIISCGKCFAKLRVPINLGNIVVTCPICKNEFRFHPLGYTGTIETEGSGEYQIPKIKTKWYHAKWWVILLLLIFPYIGIIFLWITPRFRYQTKIGLSICFALLTIVSGINLRSTPDNFLNIIQENIKPIYLPGYQNKSLLLSEFYKQSIPRVSKGKLTVPEIVKTRNKAVVLIEIFDKKGDPLGKGSGFIVHPTGVIFTNYHVLSGAYKANIKLSNGDIYEDVFLVEKNSSKDFAIIKINAEGLPTLHLGDSDKVEIGEDVIVISNPLDYQGTVSEGIISNFKEEKGRRYFQTTSQVSFGSSGGPLFNMYGEVIGIMTFIDIRAGFLNFAVPINYVKTTLEKFSNE